MGDAGNDFCDFGRKSFLQHADLHRACYGHDDLPLIENSGKLLNDGRIIKRFNTKKYDLAPVRGFGIAACNTKSGMPVGQRVRLLSGAIAGANVIRVQRTGTQESFNQQASHRSCSDESNFHPGSPSVRNLVFEQPFIYVCILNGSS